MKPIRYYVAFVALHVALRIAYGSHYLHMAQRSLRRWALRFGGVEEEKPRTPEEITQMLEEQRNAPPDRYSIDLCAWKGDDGEPVELVGMTPEQFSALKYTADAKRVTVESLLGESVRMAVGV